MTRIRYGKGSVTYPTFDASSSDVLRLDFVPKTVMAGGKALGLRSDVDGPGYTFDAATGVMRIRHDDARQIDIQEWAGTRRCGL